MAQYNHEALVNYLRDVYSMVLLVRKIQTDVQLLQDKINSERTSISNAEQMPFPVEEEVSSPVDISPRLIFYFITLFISFAFFNIPIIGTLIGVLGIIFSIIMLADSFMVSSDDSLARNKQEDFLKSQFKNNVMEYEQALKYAEFCKSDLPSQIADYNNSVSYLQEAEKNLQQVYAVNIIPNKYRTIYVAYYLYDYISSCRETDVDRVLQTMLLEQIIAKLDKIIAQQEEIILNQRMQLAKQDYLIAQSKQQHTEQMKILYGLEKNQQIQNDYLAMTEANTRITNYFVTADYINKYL